MDNSFNYYLHKLKNKSDHSNSESALEHYSLELQNFKNVFKKNNQKSRNSNTILPQIKSISRQPKNKKNLYSIYVQSRTDQLQQRLCKLQKNKYLFFRNQQINTIFDKMDKNIQYRNLQSLQRLNHFQNQPHVPPVILQPLLISMGNQTNNPYIFPHENFTNNLYNFKNNLQQNENDNKNNHRNQHNQQQSEKEIYVSKLSTNRKNYLKRRIRILCMSVYFIFIFKTFTLAVTFKRYQRFLQLDPIMQQHQTLQNFLFQKYLKLDIYNKFYKISKAEQIKPQNEKYHVEVDYDKENIDLNLKVGQIFLADLLKSIQREVQKGQFKILNPIFMSFLERGFPLPFMHVKEQLNQFQLHPQFGWMHATPQVSKILIIVYFFVKIFIFQLVGNKQILAILHKAYRKNWTQKKYILLYGKKLTAMMIILYSVINNIFFTTMKRQVNSNFKSLSNQIKPEPMKQLVCELNITQQKVNSNNKQIIKKLYCNQNHKNLFIQIFQENWKKMRKIAQLLYQQTCKQKINQVIILKKQILDEGFPDRNLLFNFRSKKQNNTSDSIKSINRRK